MNHDSPAHIHVLFEQAFNAGEAEAVAALYEPNAVLVVNGRPVTGRESIRAAYEGFLARRSRMTLQTRSVVVFDHSLAVLHGDWVLEPAQGGENSAMTRGLSTEVVRRQPDGRWRFVIDQPHTPK